MNRLFNRSKRNNRSNFKQTLLAFITILSILITSVVVQGNGAKASSLAGTGTTTGTAASANSSAPATALRLPAYFIEWGVYDRNYLPADIPSDITTINYAFIVPEELHAGNVYTYGCKLVDTYGALQKPMDRTVPGTDFGAGENIGTFNQFKVMQRNNPNLKVLMSTGGWYDSGLFPTIAGDPVKRTQFANRCADFMTQYHFDGVDIDWEFPTANDTTNFTNLLQTFREVLNSRQPAGVHYPLTIAGPSGNTQIPNINVASVSNIVDYINIMSYDYGGGWDSYTGYNAPLCSSTSDPRGADWNIDHSVALYLAGGAPASKLNLGIGYYGRGFQHLQNAGPNPTYPGRFAPVTAGDYVTGTWDLYNNPITLTGVFDYWDIRDRFGGPYVPSTTPIPGVNGYTRYWDAEQQVPYLYNPSAVGPGGTGIFVGYDDPQSLAVKVNFARTKGIGGVFVWELSQEGHPGTNEHPLTNALVTALNGPLVNFTCGGAAPTPTNTPVAPTNTPTRTATNTPTNTPAVPTATNTAVPPTQTPGGATATPVPPTSTNTPVPPTATSTAVPPSATNTAVPPTQTPGGATATPEPTMCAIIFSDVPQGSTFYDYVRCLACRSIIGGYPDNTFRPNNNVTRGQLAKIVSNAAGFNDTPGTQIFEDVVPGSTFYDFVQRLASRTFIGGYACGGAGEPCGSGNKPYFRPNNNATRGQIAKIVSNTAGFNDTQDLQMFEDVAMGSTFADFVGRLATRGYIGGYACGGAGEPCGNGNMPYFRPNNNATRGQTAKIVSNTFFPNCVVR